MNRYIVVTGGTVSKNLLETVFSKYEYTKVIACDKGLEACHDCHVKPDLVIGDFDSANAEIVKLYRGTTEWMELDTHKDYTDTHVAVQYLLNARPEEVIFVGATGTRLDHTLANIGLLKPLTEAGIRAVLLDANNRVRMIKDTCPMKRTEEYKYVSLIPYTNEVTGVTLSGFLYPAEQLTLTAGESIGVSNQLIKQEGTITIKSGLLLVIESHD